MLTAFEDRCPHRMSPRSAGAVTRAVEGTPRPTCAYHGWRFDETGRCDLIPALGRRARISKRAGPRPADGSHQQIRAGPAGRAGSRLTRRRSSPSGHRARRATAARGPSAPGPAPGSSSISSWTPRTSPSSMPRRPGRCRQGRWRQGLSPPSGGGTRRFPGAPPRRRGGRRASRDQDRRPGTPPPTRGWSCRT